MIDELDAFNAAVTLAMARLARFPFQATPQLASEIAPLAALSPKDLAVEDHAARWFFKRGERGMTLFEVYRKFWATFPLTVEAAALRLAINAPETITAGKGTLLDVVSDLRLRNLRPVPDRWAMPWKADSNQVDDVLLFAEDGLTGADLERVLGLIGVGTTLTFVRPGARCDPWFLACGARHDFGGLMARLAERAEFEQVHRSEPGEPIMVTVFGVRALRL